MLLVCIFGSRCVHAGVAGSEKAECDEQETGYGERVNDGSVDTVLLYLAQS